jgi:hypothetical protein
VALAGSSLAVDLLAPFYLWLLQRCVAVNVRFGNEAFKFVARRGAHTGHTDESKRV